jgi:hypothetical protein
VNSEISVQAQGIHIQQHHVLFFCFLFFVLFIFSPAQCPFGLPVFAHTHVYLKTIFSCMSGAKTNKQRTNKQAKKSCTSTRHTLQKHASNPTFPYIHSFNDFVYCGFSESSRQSKKKQQRHQTSSFFATAHPKLPASRKSLKNRL